MRIDSETASCDYNSAKQNMGGCGMGGTQGSGYKQGVGESVTFGTDSGGAGVAGTADMSLMQIMVAVPAVRDIQHPVLQTQK